MCLLKKKCCFLEFISQDFRSVDEAVSQQQQLPLAPTRTSNPVTEFSFYMIIIIIYVHSKLTLRVNQQFVKKPNCGLNIHDEFNIDSFIFAIFYLLRYKILTSSRANIVFEHILGETASRSAHIPWSLMWKCFSGGRAASEEPSRRRHGAIKAANLTSGAQIQIHKARDCKWRHLSAVAHSQRCQ